MRKEKHMGQSQSKLFPGFSLPKAGHPTARGKHQASREQGLPSSFTSGPQQCLRAVVAVKQYCCCELAIVGVWGDGHVRELNSLGVDGSNPRPGITLASCVIVRNRHTFLRRVLWGEDGQTASWAKS